VLAGAYQPKLDPEYNMDRQRQSSFFSNLQVCCRRRRRPPPAAARRRTLADGALPGQGGDDEAEGVVLDWDAHGSIMLTWMPDSDAVDWVLQHEPLAGPALARVPPFAGVGCDTERPDDLDPPARTRRQAHRVVLRARLQPDAGLRGDGARRGPCCSAPGSRRRTWCVVRIYPVLRKVLDKVLVSSSSL